MSLEGGFQYRYLQDGFCQIDPLSFNFLVFLVCLLLSFWFTRLANFSVRLAYLRTAMQARRVRRLDRTLIPFDEVGYFSRRQLTEHLQTRAPPPPLALLPLAVPVTVTRNTIHLTVNESVVALDFRVDATRAGSVTVLINAPCKEVDALVAAYNEGILTTMSVPKGNGKGKGKGKGKDKPKRAQLGNNGKGLRTSAESEVESSAEGDEEAEKGGKISKRKKWMAKIVKTARFADADFGRFGSNPVSPNVATNACKGPPLLEPGYKTPVVSAGAALVESLKRVASHAEEPITLPGGLSQRVDISIMDPEVIKGLKKPPDANHPRYALVIISTSSAPDENQGEFVRMLTLTPHHRPPFLITPDVVKRVVISSVGCFKVEDIFGGATEDENTESGGNEDCAICLTNPRSVVILPCRHQCVCNTCFTRMSRTHCPVCRCLVASYITTVKDEIQGGDEQG